MGEKLSLDMLKNFVAHSNAIEGVSTAESDGLYFGQHLAAAQTAAQAQKLLSLTFLHRLIMDNLLEDGQVAGRYRTVSAYIGNKPMPKPNFVPILMVPFKIRLSAIIEDSQRRNRSARIESILFALHDEALCIHPFGDGNGRTARLALNHWRRLCGFSWIDFSPAVWSEHQTRLRVYEKERFRPQHQFVYEE